MSVCASVQETGENAALPLGGVGSLDDFISRMFSGAFLLELEPGGPEKVIVRNFGSSGNVAAEKLLEAFPGDGLDGVANAFAFVVELVLLGVLGVHKAQDVV